MAGVVHKLFGIGLYLLVLAVAVTGEAGAVNPAYQLTQYGHRSWRVGGSGLAAAPISIAQTSDGYIWIGSENGLFRYDGQRFTHWTPPGKRALQPLNVRYLLGDTKGDLYVSDSQGLLRISGGRAFRYGELLRSPGPFIEDHSGVIWMVGLEPHTSALSFCSIGRERLACRGVRQGVACTHSSAVAAGRDNSLWIASEEGVCHWSPARRHDLPLTEGVGAAGPTAIAVTPDGTVWWGAGPLALDKRLFRMIDGTPRPYDPPPLKGRKITVSAMIVDRSGALWVGTYEGGVYRIFHGRVDHFDANDGLTDNRVLAMVEDHEGSLWIATKGGIDQFYDQAVIRFSSREGLSTGYVNALAARKNGDLVVATDSGLNVMRGNRWARPIATSGAMGPAPVRSVIEDREGQLWLASSENLARYDGSSFHIVRHPHGESFGPPIGLRENGAGEVWLSTLNMTVRPREGILWRVRNGAVADRLRPPAETGYHATDQLAADGRGGMWLGVYMHGLFRLRGNHYQRMPAIADDDIVSGLLPTGPDEIWVATFDGLVWLKSGRGRRLGEDEGLPCATIYGLVADHMRNLWLQTRCGLVELKRAELLHWQRDPAYRPRFALFGPADGMLSAEGVPSPVRSADGRLWFVGQDDVRMIDPQDMSVNRRPPPVTIQALIADRKRYPVIENLVLPRLTGDIEIGYAGLSFVHPDGLRFRYKLVGHDRNWIDAGPRREAFYSGLAPGRYRFRVTACNRYRICNDSGATLTFAIPAAWYQTWPFRIGCVIALLVLATAAFVVQDRRRMRAYARSLQIRFDERLDERTRVARELHDTLMQSVLASKLIADDARRMAPDSDPSAAVMARLSNWLGRAVDEGRAAVEALRMPVDENNDLGAVFEQVANACSLDQDIATQVEIVGTSRDINPAAREEIERIGSEAVRNACLHAGCSSIRILLEYRDNLVIKIRDNGKGIDPDVLVSGKEGHFGLIGMRERARRIVADLSIDCSVGGTEITLVVPARVAFPGEARSRVRSWFSRLVAARREEPR